MIRPTTFTSQPMRIAASQMVNREATIPPQIPIDEVMAIRTPAGVLRLRGGVEGLGFTKEW